MTRDRYDPDRGWTARAWDWSGALWAVVGSLTEDEAKQEAGRMFERPEVERASAVGPGAEGWRDAE